MILTRHRPAPGWRKDLAVKSPSCLEPRDTAPLRPLPIVATWRHSGRDGQPALSELRRSHRNSEGISDFFKRHHVPMFGMLFHGSAGGSAPSLLRSSIEIPSGDLTKAMRPSRGGRLMVTPWSINLAQKS